MINFQRGISINLSGGPMGNGLTRRRAKGIENVTTVKKGGLN